MQMSKFPEGWYVIYTRSRHEKKVHDRLGEMEIPSFLPTQKLLKQWNDRKKFVHEPLFPSYVFIYLKSVENYYKGMDIAGALYYVKAGKQIASVSETVINNIKLVTSQPVDIEISESHFQPGQKLVINQGVMIGLSCEVIQFRNHQKLLVRVDLLKRNLLLTLPAEYLMAI